MGAAARLRTAALTHLLFRQLFQRSGVSPHHHKEMRHGRHVTDQGTYGRHFIGQENRRKVDHLEGTDKIKLTRQSSPDGQHHHFIPVSWVDHVDQHVHLNKSGADVTSRWQHGQP